jgi:hypothetical protein
MELVRKYLEDRRSDTMVVTEVCFGSVVISMNCEQAIDIIGFGSGLMARATMLSSLIEHLPRTAEGHLLIIEIDELVPVEIEESEKVGYMLVSFSMLDTRTQNGQSLGILVLGVFLDTMLKVGKLTPPPPSPLCNATSFVLLKEKILVRCKAG